MWIIDNFYVIVNILRQLISFIYKYTFVSTVEYLLNPFLAPSR